MDNAKTAFVNVLLHVDKWFVGSLLRWGILSALLVLVGILLVFVAICMRDAKKSFTISIAVWILALVNILVRLHMQSHCIGGVGEDSLQLFNSTFVLRLLVDSLIIPGLGSVAVMIRHRKSTCQLLGTWQYYSILILTGCFILISYYIIRLADWLSGCAGLI